MTSPAQALAYAAITARITGVNYRKIITAELQEHDADNAAAMLFDTLDWAILIAAGLIEELSHQTECEPTEFMQQLITQLNLGEQDDN